MRSEGAQPALRTALAIVGTLTLVTGPYVFFLPTLFYDLTPGLSAMGPFNLHFIRDVGLAYFASGACLVIAAVTINRSLAIAGVLWPFLHAVFHVQIWIGRGSPADGVALFNFGAIVLPAVAGAALALALQPVQNDR